MSILRFSMGVAAVLFCVSATVNAADGTADLKAQVADLNAKVASMESARMGPSAGGDATSLTSMRKKGAITIGGEIQIDAVVVNRDDGINSADIATAAANPLRSRASAISEAEGDSISSTYFGTGQPYGAFLDFKVEASPDVFLYLKLDLDDNYNSAVGQDDLIEEVYFRWNHVRGSNWDFTFGKKTVNYGMDRWEGITPSFQDGSVWWMTGREGFAGESVQNQHNSVGSISGLTDTFGSAVGALPTANRHTFQFEAQYNYKDLATWSLTVFQNNDRTGGAGRLTRGMHEDRSDDSLFFQSWATKVELMPIENLVLQASFVNYHNDTFGDSQIRRAADLAFSAADASDASENQYASSLGFDYKLHSYPINFWGEWQHGFKWRYDDDVNTDTLSLGLLWGVTEAIDLSILGEWASVDGATEGALAYDNEDYYQVVLNGRYTFSSGIYLMLEYAHVWYNSDFNDRGAAGAPSRDFDADADMVGLRMGWVF